VERDTRRFHFNAWEDEDGQKTFLGRSGPFDGDAILDILLYRSLYLTVARRWWGIAGDFLQGRNFPVLECLT
jgi:hypothetical protein